MVRRAGSHKPPKRFTVSLDAEDYDRLRALAEGEGQRPALPLQFVAAYAIKALLKQAERPDFVFDLGSGLPRRKKNPDAPQ